MANRLTCVSCAGPIETEIECIECGHTLFCSIACIFIVEHPCFLMRCLQWPDEQIGPYRFDQLDMKQKKCLGRLYTCSGISRQSIGHLIDQRIHGPAFSCLFQIAGIVDIWPHMALERQKWIEVHARKVFEFDYFPQFCFGWSQSPELFVPLFTPFVKRHADQILACFDIAFTWKYVFSDEMPYTFLLNLLQSASVVPTCLQRKIVSLKIGRGQGLDLIVFGKYIQLPLVCANYEIATAAARLLKPPLNMHFVFDRIRWEAARRVYLRWLGHRDSLFFVFSKRTYTLLPNLIDYTWLGL